MQCDKSIQGILLYDIIWYGLEFDPISLKLFLIYLSNEA